MEYPRILATKSDYEFVRQNFPKDLWEKDFNNLLETQYNWFFTKVLEDNEEIEQNFVQKIVIDPQTGVRSLYIWKQDPNCKLLQLGYTEQEVINILSENV